MTYKCRQCGHRESENQACPVCNIPMMEITLQDGMPQEGGEETAPEAPMDAPTAPMDAPATDAPMDAPTDAPMDAPEAAPEAPMDAPMDTPADDAGM